MMNATAEIRTFKSFIILGALSAMLATILGAFAAHGLKPQFSEYQMHIFQTGVLYQFIHSLALICVGMILWQLDACILRIAGWLFLSGILLFSGSLYLLSMIKIQGLGVITPIGGVCFISGWFLLAIGIYKCT